MIDSIAQGIAKALYAEFGNQYKVHTEEQRQGFTGPCFFVFCINPTHELFFNRRYYRTNLFGIQFFPKDGLHPRKECNDVTERLYKCLEWIRVPENLAMGSNMHTEFTDGVLTFFVNYNMFMVKPKEQAYMETMELKQY